MKLLNETQRRQKIHNSGLLLINTLNFADAYNNINPSVVFYFSEYAKSFKTVKLKTIKRIIFFTGFTLGSFILECAGQAKPGKVALIKDNNTIYETPAVYELMNIAFALTDTSNYSGKLNIYYNVIDTSKSYYKEVINYFSAYSTHKLIKELNKHLNKSMIRYLYNLQKGYNSKIVDNNIKRNIHFPFFQRLLYGFKSVNRNLIEDFAKASNFQAFYETYKLFYLQGLEDAKNKLDISKIQHWLKTEFSSQYDKFNIVISPLMNATHFTKNFSYKGNKTSIMWVANGLGYDTTKYSQKQIAGIYTGVVFTEIDHNYVNPVSDNYKKDITPIMGDNNRAKWIKADGDGKFYSTGYKIFNEYMTHAVYLIYTNTIYSTGDQIIIENSRIKLMEQRRKYYRFGDFYRQLKTLYLSKKEGETITSLYPKILEWCKQQN